MRQVVLPNVTGSSQTEFTVTVCDSSYLSFELKMDYRESFFRFFRIEFPIECLLFHTPARNHISREPVADTVLLWNYTWHSLSHFDSSTSAPKTESTDYLVKLSIIIFITTEGFMLEVIRANFFLCLPEFGRPIRSVRKCFSAISM